MTYIELLIPQIEKLMKIRNIRAFADLAERSGLNPSTVDNIMNRKTKNINLSTLSLLAYGLEVDVSVLLDIKALRIIGGLPFDERKKMAEKNKSNKIESE